MNNFKHYITPAEAKRLDDATQGGRRKPLPFYIALAKNDAYCMVCESEKVWRYADTGMCFSCTTGEADASQDYEIIKRY